MTALAEILVNLGHCVTGLDQNVSPEHRALETASPIRMLPWFDDIVQRERFDLCVASPAIAASHPLLHRLKTVGTTVLSLHQCLANLFRNYQQICVAGTHGKSTTSAMLAWILDYAGRTPGFFVGAHQTGFRCSGRAVPEIPDFHIRRDSSDLSDRQQLSGTPKSSARWCVLESCEFSHSFRHFEPSLVVLTGVERDHFDCFPDEHSEDVAFQAFVNLLPPDGTIICNSACDRSWQIATAASRKMTTFELFNDDRHPSVDSPVSRAGSTVEVGEHWTAWRVRAKGCSAAFQLQNSQRQQYTVRLEVPGIHNVRNAIAAIAAATEAGVPPGVCCESLATFPGIRRRFEFRGHCNGMTLIDDYAHHPTAIRTTLQAAKTAFPGRRIIAAFEPHQIVRTEALFPKFVESLLLADEILLLPVFPARENVTHQQCCRTSGHLVRELNRHGAKAFLFANLDQIVSRIDHSGRPTDIILTMGAGRTNLIHDELTRRFQRHSVA